MAAILSRGRWVKQLSNWIQNMILVIGDTDVTLVLQMSPDR